ncbi:hypothetical protein [Chryseobacterium gleum]|uniref:hypothetical protein n=1 Tax=Chryseobacterium gleum TaxID=250 RepID=UPI00241C86E2|nr:hypothetical protein [Chryseobacterium gleum]
MKISQIPTKHIMVKAMTNSEWDSCDFAILTITQEWNKEQQERIERIKPFSDDFSLLSMIYSEQSITFYKDDNEFCPDSAELLDGMDWSFIEIDEDSIEKLSVPENRLISHTVQFVKNGYGYYQVYGKHTGEEFWTSEIPLFELVK